MNKVRLLKTTESLDLALYECPCEVIDIITGVAEAILDLTTEQEIDIYKIIASVGVHEVLRRIVLVLLEISPEKKWENRKPGER